MAECPGCKGSWCLDCGQEVHYLQFRCLPCLEKYLAQYKADDRELLINLRAVLPKWAQEAPLIERLINEYLDTVVAQDRVAVRAGMARGWSPNRKPMRQYQCSLCSQVGHKKNKCQTGKAPLVADQTPFSVEEDIREEFLALSWLSTQRYTR